MSGNTDATEKKKSPADFQKLIQGKVVRVKLNSGLEYTGVLACLDGMMNIVIEKAEEFENGVMVRKYNEIFLRGNNVLYVNSKPGKW